MPPPAHLDTARAYVGHTEAARNSSVHIDRWLQSTGHPPGTPYCAAFTSYCLNQTEAERPAPPHRTALATNFLQAQGTVDARKVLRGAARPEAGDVIVWRRGNGIFGHAGFVSERHRTWQGACGHTIEANTSPGRQGSQRDGSGVWRRERCIQPGNYFRIVGFVPVSYP